MPIRVYSHLRLLQRLHCTNTDSTRVTNLVKGMERYYFGSLTTAYRNYSNSFSNGNKEFKERCANNKSTSVAHNESNSQPSEETGTSSIADNVIIQGESYEFNGKTYSSYSSMIDGYLRDMREYNRALNQTIIRLKRRLFLHNLLLERQLQREKI